MKPRVKLGEATVAGGGQMRLFEHDGEYAISFNVQPLMHSKSHASETLLGDLGVERLVSADERRLLIGGLGLGYTLAAVLAKVGENAQVDVVELVPDIVAWNRSLLRDLNGALLDDARVTVREIDVVKWIRKTTPSSYDAIMLDTDNGPTPLVAESNRSLYSKKGIEATFRALRPGGRAVFWSASRDAAFEKRLVATGFKSKPVPAKTHPGAKRAAYLLYVADRPQAEK